ncbi:MAG TPA: hypothetical protein VLL94_14310, partial [Nitrospiraceae bacterium]|nr:hypothetical protein [Nitrospiraceae bacterium]
MKKTVAEGRRAYVLANNRSEGNASLTMQALADALAALPQLICGQFVEHCKPSTLQKIQPSSWLHCSRDSRVHSPIALVRDLRL